MARLIESFLRRRTCQRRARADGQTLTAGLAIRSPCQPGLAKLIPVLTGVSAYLPHNPCSLPPISYPVLQDGSWSAASRGCRGVQEQEGY